MMMFVLALLCFVNAFVKQRYRNDVVFESMFAGGVILFFMFIFALTVSENEHKRLKTHDEVKSVEVGN